VVAGVIPTSAVGVDGRMDKRYSSPSLLLQLFQPSFLISSLRLLAYVGIFVFRLRA